MYFWQDLFFERFFTAALFFCLSFKVFIEVPLFQETCSATKSSWLGACNSHPNFYPNIRGFKNLPIDRKLAHDNISLVFWKPRIFCLVLFWRRYKIVFTFKYFDIISFVSVILKKIKKIFIHIYLRCCKLPKSYSSNSSNISDYVNIVEQYRFSTTPD